MKKTGKLLQYCQFFCSFCCRVASASVPPRRRPSISIARWYRPLRVDLRPLFVWIQLFRIRCNHIPVPIIFHQTYDLPINWTGFFSVPTLPGLPQQTWWYFLNFGSDHCWQCSTRNLCSSGRLNETWPTLGACRCRWRLLTDQSTKLILIYNIHIKCINRGLINRDGMLPGRLTRKKIKVDKLLLIWRMKYQFRFGNW